MGHTLCGQSRVEVLVNDWFDAKRLARLPYVLNEGKNVILPKNLLSEISLQEVLELETYLNDHGYEVRWSGVGGQTRAFPAAEQ